MDKFSSSIFIQNITVIDVARYVPLSGKVVGDSFNVHALLSGVLDTEEQVVADFSSAKKNIKKIIDHHSNLQIENGFDHKLLICEENVSFYEYESILEVRTKSFRAKLSKDSIKILPLDVITSIDTSFLELELLLSNFISEKLQPIKVQIFLDRVIPKSSISNLFNESYAMYSFNYCHGLKNSSAYGCQNILHGHFSYVISQSDTEAKAICNYLNNSYIYSKENFNKKNSQFSYKSKNRGPFSFQRANSLEKYIEIENEPTIENIGFHVKSTLGIGSNFFISEGLQKGAVVS